MGSNPVRHEEKITVRHLGVMTWICPGQPRVSEVKGRNIYYEEVFFSKDSLLFCPPVSFFILLVKYKKVPIHVQMLLQLAPAKKGNFYSKGLKILNWRSLSLAYEENLQLVSKKKSVIL